MQSSHRPVDSRYKHRTASRFGGDCRCSLSSFEKCSQNLNCDTAELVWNLKNQNGKKRHLALSTLTAMSAGASGYASPTKLINVSQT
jgi:hypothetical protein